MAPASFDIAGEALRVLELETEGLRAFTERLRQPPGREAFVRAVQLLEGALSRGGKIVVTGLGKSGKVGQKTAATFCSTGSLAVFLHPTEGLHGDLGVVAAGDVVLAFSHTGNTDELIRLIPSLRALEAKVVAVTSRADSQLAQAANAWIDSSIPQEACPHNLAPTTSTTLALAVGDALAVSLMRLRGFDAEAFARNHPGGALGRRLTLRVADCMHGPAETGTVPADAPMDQVVAAATRSPMGAVLVVDGPRLLGIITEGDIRRALSHRERFFTLHAREVMTANPVTVQPEDLARDALEKMENRSRQISVLPVVDARSEWKGLVRLHDLVRLL
jgi:arabinose-5-phosphate isomerase